jgi:two-component system, LuxR family, response regulator FixJ
LELRRNDRIRSVFQPACRRLRKLPAMTTTPTVFVVDDDPAVLHSLQTLLDSQGLTSECYPSAEAFLDAVDARRPGCLVADLRMPGVTGIQLLQHLADNRQSRPTVVISGFAEVSSVVQSMKLGAIDVLEKPFHPAKLLSAVRNALDADVHRRARSVEQRQALDRVEGLSADERAVLAGIARGLTNREIADELDVSLRTVQFRRSSLMAALQVKSKSELIELVQRANWPGV